MRTGRTPRGFTLLEILVVILIIGVMMSLVTLAVHDDSEQRLRTEAERLAALLQLASQEAVLQSREIAVVFEEDGYRFLVPDAGEWVETGDNVYRPRSLPDDMVFDIAIEGERLEFDDSQRKREPRIYLLSGGEMTPFELTVRYRDRDYEYRLEGDIGGRLSLGE